jgi:hypothetical protein
VPLVISAKVLGSRRPLFADFSVAIHPDDFGPGDGRDGGESNGGRPTLRELLVRIVRVELAAYGSRREARRLDRVLSRAEIDTQAAAGRVAPEGREAPPAPDEDMAISTALAGFEDGLYLVAIDGREIRSLDEQVYLTPDSRVTFVRLVFLAGA